MKVSIRKRLERLENAASGHPRMPIVLIDVTKMPKADRAAHRAGDVGVLQRYGAPFTQHVETLVGNTMTSLAVTARGCEPTVPGRWIRGANLP
jgi:predicted membrane-bound mannosyltransferase